MLNRVKQFFFALNPKITFAQTIYVQEVLDSKQARLFFQMSLEDQSHCLKVAQTAEKLADKYRQNIDKEILIKAALLHDIGKNKKYSNVWYKTICVVMDKLFHDYAVKVAVENTEKLFLSKTLYYYYNHPNIGADKLRDINNEEKLALLVEWHHDKSKQSLLPELKFLQQADDLN